MISRSLRLLLAATAVLALAACTEREPLYTPKQLRPIAPETRAQMLELGMDKYSPILMRVFKAEGKLEVWKQTKNQQKFALLKSYDICRWSGDLGPKRKEGDRQAPEGFYPIAPSQLNPRSSYFLAFDTGYPNAFDRAQGRTGSNLMVHGDCSSRGCFAMTDKQMQEIFALARDAFDGGQKSFQMQILPFRMTAANLYRFRDNENMPFWRTLKEGSDHFEATLREPDVQVCNKRYVFNQVPRDPAAKFSPAEACPAAETSPQIAQAVAQKQKADALKLAEIAADSIKSQAANHTRLPVHAVYRSRQVIRASLPPAGPEALSLLPGAEAGPTTELKQIARGELQPPAQPGTETQPSAGDVAGSAIAATSAAPSPAEVQTPQTQAPQSQPASALASASTPAPPAAVATAAPQPQPAPVAAVPAPVVQTAAATPSPNAATTSVFGLLGGVVSAFAPAAPREETTAAIAGTPAPNAPRPLPSPVRAALSASAPLPTTANGAAANSETNQPKSDVGFLERTFGGLSLPGFGRKPQAEEPQQ